MRRYFAVAAIAVLTVFGLMSASCWAADKLNLHPTVKIVLHPAAAPSPVLKYPLLPPLLERRPDNAAVWYLKVPHGRTHVFANNEFWKAVDNCEDRPLPEMRESLAKYAWIARSDDDLFEQLEYSARCESCDWDTPIRDHEFWSIPLPEADSSRSLARMLVARTRLQIADGKYDEAVRTLRTGFALGRHVSQGPTLIQGLVGVTTVILGSSQMETLIQQPDAPNLYWALATLPRPMIDLRQGFETEAAAIYLSYPDLRDLDQKHYPPDEWQQLLAKTVDRWFVIQRLYAWYHNRQPTSPSDAERQQKLQAVLDQAPAAEKWLIAHGRSAAEVEAMSAPQAVLLCIMRTYDQQSDEVLKWLLMPYPAARTGLQQVLDSLKSSREAGREILPLAHELLSILKSSKIAGPRIERNIAMLEILEALRIYAAAHEGRLPESLGDIKEVPIPLDPMRDEPFLYERKGDTAVLDAPSWADTFTRRYEIRMEGAKAKP